MRVAWAPRLDVVLAGAASTVLAEGRMDDPVARLVVAEALARNLVSAPAAGEAALREADWSGDEGWAAVAFLAGEAQRTDRPELAGAAVRRLAALPVELGYGRLVLRTWLACLATGVGDEHHDACARLLARPAVDNWAGLELGLLHLRSLDVPDRLIARLITVLGGDLPGEPVGGNAVEYVKLIGLLELCPAEWSLAQAAAVTAAKNRRRVLAELADHAVGLEVLAWLTVSAGLT